MNFNICFISKNEQFLSDLQYEAVKSNFNSEIEFEVIIVSSFVNYLQILETSKIDGVFFEIDVSTFNSSEWIEIYNFLNTLNVLVVLVFNTIEELSYLKTIPIKLWRYVLLDQNKTKIHFDVYSSLHSIVEFTRVEKERRYYQETLKVTSHMFSLLNERSEFVYSSPTLKHLLGYNVGELKGKEYLKFIHPDDIDAVRAEIVNVNNSKDYIPTIEYRFLAKNGNYIQLQSMVNNQLDNSILNSLVVNSKDITQIKVIETTLKFQDEKLHKVHTLTSLGIWEWDLVNNKVFFNQQFFALSGGKPIEEFYTFEEFLQIYHPEDREEFKKEIVECCTISSQFYHEHRIIHKETSEVRWLLDRGSILERNDKGEATKIVGTTTDITNQKKVEIKLLEMNENIRKISNNIPGMLYQLVRHPDGTMFCPYVSKGIEDLFEMPIPEENFKFDIFLPKVHPEDIQDVLKSINHSADTIEIWELQFRIILPVKGTRWVHGKSRPEKLEDGTIIWHGYIHDISESKRNTEHMLRNQRMESIGTLAGGIAHDLNNVLTPIMLSIDILKSQITEPKLLNRVELIETSTIRGATMVKQILHFSRGIEGDYTPVDIKLLIDEISIMIRSSFPKNIKYTPFVEQDLPYIIGDNTQLHQVLLNLCVNARDAMPEGGNLDVDVKKFIVNDEREYRHLKLKKGMYITIFVTDTGTGMSQEVKSRIFEPFYTTKEIGSGTGLGLSTVLNIIQSHNGYIDVYSEIGKGTSFRIYLPTTTKDIEELEPTSDPEMSINNIGVLIVDDEVMIRDFTRYVLESIGFKVYLAENGAEGITVLSQNLSNISLLIVDTMMPVMDGKTAISIAKKLNPELKVIAVSGLTQKFDTTIEFENVLFLQKPYSSKQLLSAIHSLL